MMKILKDREDVRKNLLNCKVSNNELKEIHNILAISDCSSLSDLIRTSIFCYGDFLKGGNENGKRN